MSREGALGSSSKYLRNRDPLNIAHEHEAKKSQDQLLFTVCFFTVNSKQQIRHIHHHRDNNDGVLTCLLPETFSRLAFASAGG